jgi:NAD(P)H dehydrogenase (quinone)
MNPSDFALVTNTGYRSPILVTGASGGSQGATGRRVTELLLQNGFNVRAFVRTIDQRSENLRAKGAEIVVGDLLDIATVRSALQGVSRAYFCYPVRQGFVEAACIFAVAAKDNGLEAIVHLSQGGAIDNSPSRAARAHWLAEQIFNWAQVGAIHLLGALFFENVIRLAGPAVAKEGKIYLPLGDGRGVIPTVAALDVAKIAAAILAEPAKHLNKSYLVVGPELLHIREIAGVFCRVLKRPVEYVNVPLEQWRENLKRVVGEDPYLLQHLSSTVAMFGRLGLKSGREARPMIDQITAPGAISFESFLREHATEFGPSLESLAEKDAVLG